MPPSRRGEGEGEFVTCDRGDVLEEMVDTPSEDDLSVDCVTPWLERMWAPSSESVASSGGIEMPEVDACSSPEEFDGVTVGEEDVSSDVSCRSEDGSEEKLSNSSGASARLV